MSLGGPGIVLLLCLASFLYLIDAGVVGVYHVSQFVI